MSPQKADQLLRKAGFGSVEQVQNAVDCVQLDQVLSNIKRKLGPDVDRNYMQELADRQSKYGSSCYTTVPISVPCPIHYDENDYENNQTMYWLPS